MYSPYVVQSQGKSHKSYRLCNFRKKTEWQFRLVDVPYLQTLSYRVTIAFFLQEREWATADACSLIRNTGIAIQSNPIGNPLALACLGLALKFYADSFLDPHFIAIDPTERGTDENAESGNNE